MFRDMRHYALGAGEELLEEAHGMREGARGDVTEERVIDAAQLR
jgi:hypothetical protein